MKLNNYYDKIQAICDSLDEIIGELQEKQIAIEEKAIEHDRDMTEKEEELYYRIDYQIQAIGACKYNLEDAINEIEEYINNQ